jgi:small-conductance mechanosensitive channel
VLKIAILFDHLLCTKTRSGNSGIDSSLLTDKVFGKSMRWILFVLVVIVIIAVVIVIAVSLNLTVENFRARSVDAVFVLVFLYLELDLVEPNATLAFKVTLDLARLAVGESCGNKSGVNCCFLTDKVLGALNLMVMILVMVIIIIIIIIIIVSFDLALQDLTR